MPQPAPTSPTVLRIILGRQLQALREKAGMTYEQAADAIYASAWTLRRMEKAEVGLKLNYVKSLLLAYGVTDVREIDSFLGLAREANKRGWWHSYTDVLPAWFRVFPGLEQAAELICGYEPHCVPGLLQTEDYARALTTAGYPNATHEETSRRVALRMARQQILTRPDPPRLWAVIDEAVLRRPVGGPGVMRAQFDRLIEATGQPNVTLQVLPFTAGAHPVMYGMFHLPARSPPPSATVSTTAPPSASHPPNSAPAGPWRSHRKPSAQRATPPTAIRQPTCSWQHRMCRRAPTWPIGSANPAVIVMSEKGTPPRSGRNSSSRTRQISGWP